MPGVSRMMVVPMEMGVYINSMNFIKENKRSLIISLVVFVGLIITVLLIQRQQSLRSKADSGDVINAFEVTDNNGTPLSCPNGVCDTQSLDVKVKLRDLEPLKRLHQE